MKRTYTISTQAVAAVKQLAEERSVASTQDGVVEVAIWELARRIRDDGHAEEWARAGEDPEFVAEAERLSREFGSDDRAAWPERKAALGSRRGPVRSDRGA